MSPDDRRAAIVDIALPLLREHGPALTTRQVAEAAGHRRGHGVPGLRQQGRTRPGLCRSRVRLRAGRGAAPGASTTPCPSTSASPRGWRSCSTTSSRSSGSSRCCTTPASHPPMQHGPPQGRRPTRRSTRPSPTSSATTPPPCASRSAEVVALLQLLTLSSVHPLLSTASPRRGRDRRRRPRRHPEEVLMLYRLVRTHLRPYAVPLGVLLALQLVATLAIAVPARASTGGSSTRASPWATPASSCAPVSGCSPSRSSQILATIARHPHRRPDLGLPRARRPLVRLPPGRRLLGPGALPLRRPHAHQPQHQRRHPGADGRLHVPAMMVSAPIMMVGGIVMALREDVGLSWLVAVAVPALARRDRPRHPPDGPPLPAMQKSRRLGQPHPARADHRRAGRAGLRPRGRRARALRRGQRDLHRDGRRRRAAHGAGLPPRHGHLQRLDRGGAVVRRGPGRRRRRCRSAPSPRSWPTSSRSSCR